MDPLQGKCLSHHHNSNYTILFNCVSIVVSIAPTVMLSYAKGLSTKAGRANVGEMLLDTKNRTLLWLFQGLGSNNGEIDTFHRDYMPLQWVDKPLAMLIPRSYTEYLSLFLHIWIYDTSYC
jgi:hypothetical protein